MAKKKSIRTFKYTSFARFIAIVAIVLLAATGYMWWQNVYTTPDAVFSRMLQRNMQTHSFGRTTSQQQGTQGLDVTAQHYTAPYHLVRTVNTLTQGEQTRIVTENITTTDKNYVRYLDIQTQQEKADGGQFDFSNVLNQWGVVDATGNEQSPAAIYTQNIAVPIANLSPEQRERLYEQIVTDNVYSIDYQNIQTTTIDGRKAYTYNVTVSPVPYIKMLKTLGSMLQQEQLAQIDPEQYADVAPLEFIMTVDVMSARLLNVAYGQTQQVEQYGGYNLIDIPQIPDDTIPLQELQARLQQLQ